MHLKLHLVLGVSDILTPFIGLLYLSNSCVLSHPFTRDIVNKFFVLVTYKYYAVWLKYRVLVFS